MADWREGLNRDIWGDEFDRPQTTEDSPYIEEQRGVGGDIRQQKNSSSYSSSTTTTPKGVHQPTSTKSENDIADTIGGLILWILLAGVIFGIYKVFKIMHQRAQPQVYPESSSKAKEVETHADTKRSQLTAPGLTLCNSCKKSISSRAPQCPKCGTTTATLPCIVCKQDIPRDSSVCPECGDPNPFGQKTTANHQAEQEQPNQPLKTTDTPRNQQDYCDGSCLGVTGDNGLCRTCGKKRLPKKPLGRTNTGPNTPVNTKGLSGANPITIVIIIFGVIIFFTPFKTMALQAGMIMTGIWALISGKIWLVDDKYTLEPSKARGIGALLVSTIPLSLIVGLIVTNDHGYTDNANTTATMIEVGIFCAISLASYIIYMMSRKSK